MARQRTFDFDPGFTYEEQVAAVVTALEDEGLVLTTADEQCPVASVTNVETGGTLVVVMPWQIAVQA